MRFRAAEWQEYGVTNEAVSRTVLAEFKNGKMAKKRFEDKRVAYVSLSL